MKPADHPSRDDDDDDQSRDCPIPKKRKKEVLDCFVSESFISGNEDWFRTGAKPVNPEDIEKDGKDGVGVDFHIRGIGRTKTGRGPPSMSMSCSDKLAKWIAVGIQGGLLSNVFDPIYISSVNIGPAFASLDLLSISLKRLAPQSSVEVNLITNIVQLEFTKSPAAGSKQNLKIVPESSSSYWYLNGNIFRIDPKFGIRLGSGKSSKSLKNHKNHLDCSRGKMWNQFRDNNLSSYLFYNEAKLSVKIINSDWSKALIGSLLDQNLIFHTRQKEPEYESKKNKILKNISWKHHTKKRDRF